jgi:hypothetical protein
MTWLGDKIRAREAKQRETIEEAKAAVFKFGQQLEQPSRLSAFGGGTETSSRSAQQHIEDAKGPKEENAAVFKLELYLAANGRWTPKSPKGYRYNFDNGNDNPSGFTLTPMNDDAPETNAPSFISVQEVSNAASMPESSEA